MKTEGVGTYDLLFNFDLNNIMLNVGRREGKGWSCGEWGPGNILLHSVFIYLLLFFK